MSRITACDFVTVVFRGLSGFSDDYAARDSISMSRRHCRRVGDFVLELCSNTTGTHAVQSRSCIAPLLLFEEMIFTSDVALSGYRTGSRITIMRPGRPAGTLGRSRPRFARRLHEYHSRAFGCDIPSFHEAMMNISKNIFHLERASVRKCDRPAYSRQIPRSPTPRSRRGI